MLDNENAKKVILEEEQQVVEEFTEECSCAVEEEKPTEISTCCCEKVKFSNRFLSNFIDTAVNAGISVVLFYAVNFIMKATVGIYFANIPAAILIFFTVISVFASPIMESCKCGNTIGKRVAGLKTIKSK